MKSMQNREENFNPRKRYTALFATLLCVFGVLMGRAGYITLVQGEAHNKEAQGRIYKKIILEAPRGEIRDRNGILLAGSRPIFSVQIEQNQISPKRMTEVLEKVSRILRENEETLIDSFPLYEKDGHLVLSFDEKLKEWKEKNGFSAKQGAKECFYIAAQRAINSGLIQGKTEEDKFSLQKKMMDIGVYLPVSLNNWEFTQVNDKNKWLASYLKALGVPEKEYDELSPNQIYEYVRLYNGIAATVDARTSRDIMVLRDALISKGYLQYEPVEVAVGIKKQTVAKIEEMAMDLGGVSVHVKSARYYPNKNLASHVLGQMGKISEDEINTYVKEKGYSTTSTIGKTGVERSYEEALRGQPGYREVMVDASGRLISEMKHVAPVPGKTVYLTIDSALQQVATDSLQKALSSLQKGQYYSSRWGDIRMRDRNYVFTKATSGATVVMDVKTGKILAMDSLPNYDPNEFVKGISRERYASLYYPDNKNDPLAPKPLYNTATMTAVQPGSIFKMITAIAAMENGMNPDYTIQDKGYIVEGGLKFGCWLWNTSGNTHGAENMIRAIRDSCNYYFYCISVGYDYAKEKPLDISMSAEKIIYYAKLFGLNEKSGVEIEESKGKVPDPAQRMNRQKNELEKQLNKILKDAFLDITNIDPQYSNRIKAIAGWMEDNPARGRIIEKLKRINIKPEMVNGIADLIKYSYFNQGAWRTGDTFNMAIGQGDHRYTPVQLANYISALANGGRLNKASVVDRVENFDKTGVEMVHPQGQEIPLKNSGELNIIIQGMKDVTDDGTAKAIFQNFPIKVASKTGTAQKDGRIPTADEKAYLLSHLKYYGVKENEVLELARELKKNSDGNYSEEYFIRAAILQLNPSAEIDRFKDEYDAFAWFASFAPADDPQIAIVTLIFQGGHGGNAAVPARDIYSAYFGLDQPALSPADANP